MLFHFIFLSSRVMIAWLGSTSAVTSVVDLEGYVNVKIFSFIFILMKNDVICLLTDMKETKTSEYRSKNRIVDLGNGNS